MAYNQLTVLLIACLSSAHDIAQNGNVHPPRCVPLGIRAVSRQPACKCALPVPRRSALVCSTLYLLTPRTAVEYLTFHKTMHGRNTNLLCRASALPLRYSWLFWTAELSHMAPKQSILGTEGPIFSRSACALSAALLLTAGLPYSAPTQCTFDFRGNQASCSVSHSSSAALL